MKDVVVRCSSLASYPDCNRRGAARLFREEIEAAGFKLNDPIRGAGAAVGTAAQKSASVVLMEKARSGGTLPPRSVAEDCANDEVKEQMRGGVMFDGPRGATRNRDDALKQAVGIARTYHAVIAPHVEPILIEEQMEAEVAPGLILTGRPDLVAREPGQIRDLKTGVRLGNYAAQGGGYSLLARTPRPDYPKGIDIQDASIDYIQRVRPDKPQPPPITQKIPIEAAETAAVNILRHIEEDIRVFRHGDERRHIIPGDPWAFQSNPQSVLCSRRYCVAHGTSWCRDWLAKPGDDE
jgi:hypothetical protein